MIVIGGGSDCERWKIFDQLADRLVLSGQPETNKQVRMVRTWAEDRDARVRKFGIWNVRYPAPSPWPPSKKRPSITPADAGPSKRLRA